MQKQQITTGTPIPPEWYNAMQTPTYEGTDEEVGHLPLPPNYGEKQQWKTFMVEGAENTVNLGDWDRNAIVRVGPSFTNGNTVWPSSLTINCSSALNGVIFVVPDLSEDDSEMSVTYNFGDFNSTKTVKKGEILVWYVGVSGTYRVPRYIVFPSYLTGIFKTINAVEKVNSPVFHVGNAENGIDIEYDLDQTHTATYLGLLFGGFGGLSSSQVIHFPLIHVWKQATFEKDVTIKADAVIEKTLRILQSLTVVGQITASEVSAINTPNTTVSIGNPTQEGGDVSYLEWQLKGVWQVGQVKKIFNDTGHDINQVVFVPTHAGGATVGTWKNISFPAHTYREFTCVGHESGVGSQFAILAPSA